MLLCGKGGDVDSWFCYSDFKSLKDRPQNVKKAFFLGNKLVNVVLPAKLHKKNNQANRNHTLKSVLFLVTMLTLQLRTLNSSSGFINLFISPKKRMIK